MPISIAARCGACFALAVAGIVNVGLWGRNAPAQPNNTVGAAETVRIYPGGMEFLARIDTGAATSSINARRIRPFKRGGRRWVGFEIAGKRGQVVAMERAVIRVVRIITFDGTRKRRYVVRIGICLGDVYKEAQVSLADRRHRAFPVLIGRRFMAGKILVDPGREFVTRPRCPGRK